MEITIGMSILKVCSLLVVVLVTVSTAPVAPYGGGPGYGQGYGAPDYYEDRDYRFNYAVKDDYTYNYQTRNENKYGNTVTGQYTVLEPTGELRVVNYIADDYGFRADVQHQPFGPGYHP